MRYSGNKICPGKQTDERLDGQPNQKHNVFADTDVWKRHNKIDKLQQPFYEHCTSLIVLAGATPSPVMK